MENKSEFLVQLLQKLGAPLAAAVHRFSSGNQQEDAANLASLITESVKASIALAQSMNVRPNDGDANAIRTALAALAATLLADSYAQQGRLPVEADQIKITKLLESVIVFSDNFTPAAEHAGRLATLDKTPVFFDAVQSNIYAMHAMLPVIGAVAGFSFGQPEAKLIQDIAERLRVQAKDFSGRLVTSGGAMSELVILQALAQLYASAHREGTRKMTQGDGASVTLESVWADYNVQVSMVETLMLAFGSGDQVGSGRAGGGVKPQIEQSQSSEAQPAVPLQQAAGSSPMAFFKKK